jgi:hypothetical protein
MTEIYAQQLIGSLFIYFIVSDGRMTDKRWIEKALEGGGRGLSELLFRPLPGRTEENHRVRQLE